MVLIDILGDVGAPRAVGNGPRHPQAPEETSYAGHDQ